MENQNCVIGKSYTKKEFLQEKKIGNSEFHISEVIESKYFTDKDYSDWKHFGFGISFSKYLDKIKK